MHNNELSYGNVGYVWMWVVPTKRRQFAAPNRVCRKRFFHLKDQTEFNSLNNQKNEQDIRLSHRLNILSSHTISELDSASKNINPFREVKLLTQFNELIIQNPKSIPGRYKILNSLGQTIKTGRLTQDEISINLKAGIYFVSMYNGNSQITSKIYIDEN